MHSPVLGLILPLVFQITVVRSCLGRPSATLPLALAKSIYQTSDWLLTASVHEECICGQLFAANKLVDRLRVPLVAQMYRKLKNLTTWLCCLAVWMRCERAVVPTEQYNGWHINSRVSVCGLLPDRPWKRISFRPRHEAKVSYSVLKEDEEFVFI